MSFFGVTIEEIESIYHHPNADKLDICKLKDLDFQFIVQKDEYKVGDIVLYFPVDSILPLDLMEKIGFTRKINETEIEGCLFGKDKNRVKTVSLRGEISQGIISPLHIIENLDINLKDSTKITEFLGVTKYEPLEIPQSPDWLSSLPSELLKYDIEGAERNKDIVEYLMNVPICITEKIEGTNFSATYRFETDEFFINQRSNTILPEAKNHPFWRWANENKLKQTISQIKLEDGNSITLYGEFIGPKIQGNIYKLKNHKVLFYDIKTGDEFLSVTKKMKIFSALFYLNENIITVPVLHYNNTLKNILNDVPITKFSNGISKLYDTLREGIIITPMKEQTNNKIGRLIIKQRSPEYLSKSNL